MGYGDPNVAQALSTPGHRGHRPVDLDDDGDDLGKGTRAKPVDLTEDDDGCGADSKKRKRTKKQEKSGEKRLKRYRSQAPHSYHDTLARAQSQRFLIIDRASTGTEDNPEQTMTIAGTTGNLYTVKINRLPSCTCPHALKGNQCKHIVYILHNTLKAPIRLQYQVAFMTSELHDIFSKAPPIPGSNEAVKAGDGQDPIRKPIEDDCPICCLEFSPDTEEVVYCKSACGNNIHKRCFEQWATQKQKSGNDGVTCPFCRTPWQGDEDMVKTVDMLSATHGRDGYLNVASQLGLSGLRDYSSYHQPWVRIQRRAGYLVDGEDEAMWC